MGICKAFLDPAILSQFELNILNILRSNYRKKQILKNKVNLGLAYIFPNIFYTL